MGECDIDKMTSRFDTNWTSNPQEVMIRKDIFLPDWRKAPGERPSRRPAFRWRSTASCEWSIRPTRRGPHGCGSCSPRTLSTTLRPRPNRTRSPSRRSEAGDRYPRNKSNPSHLRDWGHFAQGQNRTADTGIFSPLLYRLSYLGIGCDFNMLGSDILFVIPWGFLSPALTVEPPFFLAFFRQVQLCVTGA